MGNYYKVAGLILNMDSFGRTVVQAEPYKCEPTNNVDIFIRSNWRELQKNQPHLNDSDSEYISTCGNFYCQLLKFDGLMLHASAVVLNGKAYLFSAMSGTGKSTHTSLWLKIFGDQAAILNDDKPALRLEDGIWYAYGTPWSGKHDISMNVRVPVGGIAMIERAAENSIERCSGHQAIFSIMEQTIRPTTPQMRMKLLEILDKLITQVPVWKLRCNMEDDAVRVSYEAMSGEKLTNEGE